MKRIPFLVLSAFLLIPLAACEEKTPAQKAQNKIDDALDRRPNEKIRDAAEDARDGVKDAAKKTGEVVEEAAEKTKEVVQDAAEKTKEVVHDAAAGVKDATE